MPPCPCTLVFKLQLDSNSRPRPLSASLASRLRRRRGHVLGERTLLMSDHFPGCQLSHLPKVIEGAPNFRGIPGLDVYGCAMPTLAGMRKALAFVGAAPGRHELVKEGGEGGGDGSSCSESLCSESVHLIIRRKGFSPFSCSGSCSSKKIM